jgi:hypothetical protein
MWNGGSASSYSQQEIVHYPVSVPKKEYYYPIQTQSVRADHWDLPIGSNLSTVSIFITACPRSSFANSNVKSDSQMPPRVEAGARDMSQESYGSLPSTSTAWAHQVREPASSQAAYLQPNSQHGTPPSKTRSYNRPGREPAVKFEPDAVKLRRLCERRRGSSFAVDWVVVVFKYGVTKEALLRPLDSNEVDQMDFHGGFEPRQAYDGFISKIGDWYECGLCKEGKVTHWKNKKDAPRHLRKFHFGLGDPCRIWCVV